MRLDDSRYFSQRELHCRARAAEMSDPYLKRIYLEFAQRYASNLRQIEDRRPALRRRQMG